MDRAGTGNIGLVVTQDAAVLLLLQQRFAWGIPKHGELHMSTGWPMNSMVWELSRARLCGTESTYSTTYSTTDVYSMLTRQVGNRGAI